ncbi:MAG: hypothetical protein HOP08_01650 [Cyclobacteriaceae bacterium]|nr:hypothetical protein [Cyclobacteriaceae bacterium]
MEFLQQLAKEKKDFLIRANGGIGLPAAGTVYWVALAIAGTKLTPQQWYPVAAAASGLIFPLGILLARPLKSDVLAKSPLTSLMLPALIGMLMFWPLAIAGASIDVSFFPLALAVGMGMHWPVVGWMYGGKIFLFHGIARAVGCTFLWFAFPDERFVWIPIYVAVIYFVTILGIRREVKIAIAETSQQ